MDIQNISFEVDAIKGQYTQNLMRQVRGCCSTAGGTGGKAVNLNGNSITWVSGDTSRIWGAVS
jgi:hypothetical protein